MGRLKYAQKFVLIGLVLIAPLAFVVKSYLDQQSTQIGFSQKERVGVVYVKPASELLARIAAARAVAVRVAAHEATPATLAAPHAEIQSAIRAVDAVTPSAGATLALGREWDGLKRQIQAEIEDVAAVAEQSSASTEQVSASTETTSASAQNIAASAQQLAATALTLEQLVGRFRVSS